MMPVGSPVASRSIFAAGRVGGCGGDVGGGEGCGVGDGDVAVGAGEDGGMAGGDGVDVLTGGEGFGRARWCGPSLRPGAMSRV